MRPAIVLALAFGPLVAARAVAAEPQSGVHPSTRASAATTTTAGAAFVRLAAGALVQVEVERALYERAGSGHFFVRVRVTNRTARGVGIELAGSRWHTLYPNQWGRGDEAARQVIDERRTTVTPLGAAEQSALRGAFARGALAMVPAGGALEYFAEFNASGRREVDARAGRFVIVSMAGELRVTDGARVEQLAFDFSPRAPQSTDVAVPAAPLAWQQVPAAARVVLSP